MELTTTGYMTTGPLKNFTPLRLDVFLPLCTFIVPPEIKHKPRPLGNAPVPSRAKKPCDCSQEVR